MSVIHPVFHFFPPWRGYVPSGYSVNFLGMKTDESFFSDEPAASPVVETFVETGYPTPGPSYFDLVALLEAVVSARRQFTMVELGAGYGYWSVAGGLAARARGLPCYLIAVEAEPGHFEMVKRHFADNGFSPSDHLLLRSAVHSEDGQVNFIVGHSKEWFGQAIVSNQDVRSKIYEHAVVQRVPAVSLNTLLTNVAQVDVIHMDVQGIEHDVLSNTDAEMLKKVKTVIIGTHARETEQKLRGLFSRLMWSCSYDFTLQARNSTEFGEIEFDDGLQVWQNPLVSARRSAP